MYLETRYYARVHFGFTTKHYISSIADDLLSRFVDMSNYGEAFDQIVVYAPPVPSPYVEFWCDTEEDRLSCIEIVKGIIIDMKDEKLGVDLLDT